MNGSYKIRYILFLLLFIFSGIIMGQPPQLINYQAQLTDPATGQPVPDGTYQIVFSVYDSFTGGTPVWTETQNVQVQNGLYSILLGSVNALTNEILNGPEKYLGITVENDPEMTPRKRIVSVAYAIISREADKLDGKDASEFANAIHNHNDQYYTKSELSSSDGNPPNQGSNRVSWDNLADVPAGFADGTDDGGSGGNTLDQAYNQGGAGLGRTIVADAGAVVVDGPDGLVVNGKVGIGTTNPNEKLEVTAGNLGIVGSGNGIKLHKTGPFVAIGEIMETDGFLDLKSVLADNNTALRFFSTPSGGFPTERMRIAGNGNIGIGITNPVSKLDIDGDISFANRKLYFAGAYNPTYYMQYVLSSGLRFVVNSQDNLFLSVTGRVGIGTTIPDFTLHVNGTAGKPGGGSWLSASDRRLKEIKGHFNRGIDAIMRLNPVLYNYKKYNPLNLPITDEYIGFIAQEVEEVIPEAVKTNPEGYLYINNDPIIWAMLNGIKELKNINDQLVMKNEALETENTAMKKNLDMIQNELGDLKDRMAGFEQHIQQLTLSNISQ